MGRPAKDLAGQKFGRLTALERDTSKPSGAGNTITCIINGTRRKNLTKDYITPLRKNIAYNLEIFLSLHPEYKEKLP